MTNIEDDVYLALCKDAWKTVYDLQEEMMERFQQQIQDPDSHVRRSDFNLFTLQMSLDSLLNAGRVESRQRQLDPANSKKDTIEYHQAYVASRLE